MTINIEYESEISLDIVDYEELINKVILKSLEVEECPYEIELNIILTDNENIQAINNRFRNIDKATDVLSFPMIEYESPSDFSDFEEESADEYFNPETGELVMGDIMVSVEKLIEQAEDYGHSRARELGFLVAHSMLHLFGYDHVDDKEREIMETKQTNILNELN